MTESTRGTRSAVRKRRTRPSSRSTASSQWSAGTSGYLDSLKCYLDSTGDTSFEENLRRGFDYFRDTFFEDDGLPRYYHDRTYPVDIQCASQAIDTLARFADLDPNALDLSVRTAEWTIDNMQDGLMKEIDVLRAQLQRKALEETNVKIFVLDTLQEMLAGSDFDPPGRLLRVLQSIKEDYQAFMPKEGA